MALWKVVADRIKLFPHGNSEKLQVGKIGKFQVVVSKENGYRDGDLVVFAPERSVLPEEIRGHYVNSDTGITYLAGDDHDRVCSRRLRGELSEGVTLPLEWVGKTYFSGKFTAGSNVAFVEDLPLNWDLSKALGITKYIPPIPEELVGKVSHMNEATFESRFVKHDVENFHTFKDEFCPGEPVDLTEKVNGSQINVMKDSSGRITITSKYLGQDGIVIDEDPGNKYWRAFNNSGLRQFFSTAAVADLNLQVIAEAIPFAKGFPYGLTEPSIRIYRLVVEGREIPRSLVWSQPEWGPFKQLWVPYIATIPFDPASFPMWAKGSEMVSDKGLHIREGIVITPAIPRASSEGHGLSIKWLNPKYKGSAEDIS